MLTETYPKPFDVARVLIRGLYHCTLSSIARQYKMAQSNFFFLFSFFLRQNHIVLTREPENFYRTILDDFKILFSLSLSLSRKFTRRFEDHQQTGRDRRIRGYFRWFGSIRSAVSHSKHETQWNFSSFSLPRLPRRSTSVLPILRVREPGM